MDLKEYEQIKFALADQLRALEALMESGSTSMRDPLQELFARLAEDRFNLVVVGRFSRGKTSLMNALLGTDRLPTDILPLTSVITTVVYGSAEQVVIRYQKGGPEIEVPLGALPDYITQQGNPGNVRGVRTAEIRLAQEILRRGFHFIDTPGLGSLITENTRTTEQFLPQADAFLLVTSYESPLSEEEMSILNTASASLRRVFVAVNKHDTVSAKEREDVLRYVREQLGQRFGADLPCVFSVSARDGIAARQARDAACMEKSGIPELEQALTRYLLAQKHATFLRRFCDRLIDLAARALPDDRGAQLIESVKQQYQRIGNAQSGPRLHADELRDVASGAWKPSSRCEICTQIQVASFEALRTYQHELANHAQTQARHARRGGFCRMHMRQYALLAPPHDMCVGHAALVARLASQLAAAASSLLAHRDVPGLPDCVAAAGRDCAICEVAARAQRQAVAAAAHRLSSGRQAAFDSLSLLCIPHLGGLLWALDDVAISRRVLMGESARLERLSEDMRRYETKHDAIRRHLASDEESRSAHTALAVLAGLPNGQVGDA